MTSAAAGEYLVSHGVAGDFGRFRAAISLRRGDRVVIRTGRGEEAGEVLCPATVRHAHLMTDDAAGEVVRLLGPDDEERLAGNAELGERLLAEAQERIGQLGLTVELLDVEVLFDGLRAVIQHVRWGDADVRPLVSGLSTSFGLHIVLEDLTRPAQEHGCGSCGSGCGSCGSGSSATEVQAHFAQLREQMERRGRVPLL